MSQISISRRIARRLTARASKALGRCLMTLVLTLASGGLHVHAETRWPSPALPDGLATFGIGEQMVVNGLPMRLRGFVSERRPDDLLEALRSSLGKPLADNAIGGKRILGRAENGFYITVQVEAAGSGSKGTVAVTDLSALSRNRDQQHAVTARWLERLPAGSTIASQMSSEENGRAARHTVIVNSHSEALNRDAVMAMMTRDGYVLEREMTPDATVRATLPVALANARTLYFKAPGKEAMAVVARSGAKTSIVVNTAVTLEGFK